jgi:hypothetical protein
MRLSANAVFLSSTNSFAAEFTLSQQSLCHEIINNGQVDTTVIERWVYFQPIWSVSFPLLNALRNSIHALPSSSSCLLS